MSERSPRRDDLRAGRGVLRFPLLAQVTGPQHVHVWTSTFHLRWAEHLRDQRMAQEKAA